jgi:hypothetical protein
LRRDPLEGHPFEGWKDTISYDGLRVLTYE